ncbi:unnamed protein product [Effrenium voratum]|nr:unnamed protein product [Effrenium voratum]
MKRKGAPSEANVKGKKRRKKDAMQPGCKDKADSATPEVRPEVQQVLEELADPETKGTLSDRLNPTHPRFDKKLKASWKSFSKKERAAIVECDQKKMKATVSAVVSIQHPFEVNGDDHCETSLEAYRDVEPIFGDSRCLSFNPTFGLRWASGRSGSRIADGFAMANYEQIAGAAMEKLDGMCWPVEWFKEDLPVETKDGAAMDIFVEKMINRSNTVPKLMDPWCKGQVQEPLEIPKPDPPAKMNILAFSDGMGFCKNLLANAPEGRISMKKVVENYHSMTQEDVKKLVTEPKKGWDMIIFAVGCDPPRSNSVDDVIEQNTIISRLYYWLAYEIQRAEGSCRKVFCLVRGLFHEDKKTHMKAGLGLTVCGTLFGMTNTARQELEGVDMHFCDTEYFLPDDSPIWPQVAAEAFRESTFGMIDVRILNSGRYVEKRVSSRVYEAANKEFPLPNDGVICISGGNGALGLVMGNWLLDKAEEQGVSGFNIRFLSRSMKISDLNMPLWKDIESKAARLGIKVEQGKMDMSSAAGCSEYIVSLNGELRGFIHSAGVLQDSMLMNMTWEKFETVFASKHHAALYLHDALEKNPQKDFRFMWNFSSTSVYGNMGQLNYSGSNSFLDVLTRHRKAKGRPSLAIQWGAWGDVGMAATMTDAMRLRTMNSPMPYFSNKEGLHGLECGLATGLAYFSVFKINPGVMMGTVQNGDVVQACYWRNHYSEVCPTPPATTLERKHYYTIYRMAKGPQIMDPKAKALVYDAYVKETRPRNTQLSGATIFVSGRTQMIGRDPKKLRIYDPFYCAGSVVKHLAELGFSRVYNKCEDFYAVMNEGRVPAHDVLLTNPPYSGDHVEHLLRFCRENEKPFLLLMPNYFCAKEFYAEAGTKSMLYLCPRKRYFYWTPKGLRDRGKVQSQHAGSAGNRTSPFVSFWYLDLKPVCSSKDLLRWWQARSSRLSCTLCRLKDLPAACKP